MGLCGRECPRYGLVSMAQDQELLLAIDRELPGGARSELSRTLRRNFHALRERIGERPDWAALARIFAEHGVVDRNGKPPSRHALRKAWGRLLRAMEAAERKRTAPQAAAPESPRPSAPEPDPELPRPRYEFPFSTPRRKD